MVVKAEQHAVKESREINGSRAIVQMNDVHIRPKRIKVDICPTAKPIDVDFTNVQACIPANCPKFASRSHYPKLIEAISHRRLWMEIA